MYPEHLDWWDLGFRMILGNPTPFDIKPPQETTVDVGDETTYLRPWDGGVEY